jgi:hypothetical protein
MGLASRYWQWVSLAVGGTLKRETIASAKHFWQQQFSQADDRTEVADLAVQSRLLQLLNSENETSRQLAECCLRCFIAVQIEQTCISLESSFGQQHGFTRQDLFPYVLTDREPLRSQLHSTGYRALALEILQTFDSTQGSSLAVWTTRLVKSQPELRQFLLEQGVLMLSDWAILNDTSLVQVRRILSEVSPRSEPEIQRACELLENYHAVYLRDRRRQRRGSKLCSDPSPSQLQEIVQRLQKDTPETVLARLRSLAMILRQHRLQVRSKVFRIQVSLDLRNEEGVPIIDPATPVDAAQMEQDQFLSEYHLTFEQCLDQAITQITSDRLAQLKPPKDRQWLKALFLMHCQGMKMEAIAAALGLRAQYAVSRLLGLNAFRTDIRHALLGKLGDRIQSLAKDYADPACLQNLDERLNTLLAEQVDGLMDAARAETSLAQPLNSRFARRLCHHLDDRRIEQ